MAAKKEGPNQENVAQLEWSQLCPQRPGQTTHSAQCTSRDNLLTKSHDSHTPSTNSGPHTVLNIGQKYFTYIIC